MMRRADCSDGLRKVCDVGRVFIRPGMRSSVFFSAPFRIWVLRGKENKECEEELEREKEEEKGGGNGRREPESGHQICVYVHIYIHFHAFLRNPTRAYQRNTIKTLLHLVVSYFAGTPI